MLALVTIALLLVACSGDGSRAHGTTPVTIPTTTSTTLPEPVLRQRLGEFFTGEGKALLEVEQRTKGLSTGSLPTRADCKVYVDALGVIGSGDYMVHLTELIPDPALSKAFHDEVALKRLTLAACGTGQPLPQRTVGFLHRYYAELQTLMARHGYVI